MSQSYKRKTSIGAFNLKKQVIKHQKTSKPKTAKKACGLREKVFKKSSEHKIPDYKTEEGGFSIPI